MTTFQDGPAKGKTLMLKRAPVFLRVTELLGEIDGLDQLTDEPEPGETLHAYVLTEKPGHMHLNTGRKPGGGFFPIAVYKLVADQPNQSTMKETGAWQAWTRRQECPENLR